MAGEAKTPDNRLFQLFIVLITAIIGPLTVYFVTNTDQQVDPTPPPSMQITVVLHAATVAVGPAVRVVVVTPTPEPTQPAEDRSEPALPTATPVPPTLPATATPEPVVPTATTVPPTLPATATQEPVVPTAAPLPPTPTTSAMTNPSGLISANTVSNWVRSPWWSLYSNTSRWPFSFSHRLCFL